MHDTKVTVAIPTYNRSEFLKVCLESVLVQDYPDFHVVVLDNASSDNTESVVHSLADPRLTYVRNETNIGIFRNWNRAIKVNASTYLNILPDDDTMLPGFISESVLALDSHPRAAFSFALARYIDKNGAATHLQDAGDLPDGRIGGSEYLHRIVAGQNVVLHPATVMMRSSALELVGPFDNPHSYHTIDFNLYLRMAACFDIAFIRKELSQVRLHIEREGHKKYFEPGGAGPLATMAERMDAISYLLQSTRAEDALYRNWLGERLLHLSMRRSEFTQHLVPNLNLTWKERLVIAKEEIEALIPAGETFILVDEDQLGIVGDFADCKVFPFLERDGMSWGPPPDATAAVRELERLRQSGANFIVFGWPGFWWLDYYSELRDYLYSEFNCVLKNSRIVVFDLQRNT